jgi:hypothetical protein
MENFWPVSLKTLFYCRFFSGSRIRISVELFFPAIGKFYSLRSLLLVDFPQCTVRIIAGFQKNFMRHKRFPVSILRIKSHLKDLWQGLMKEFTKLISNFIEASKPLILIFPSTSLQEMLKTIISYTEGTDLIC